MLLRCHWWPVLRASCKPGRSGSKASPSPVLELPSEGFAPQHHLPCSASNRHPVAGILKRSQTGQDLAPQGQDGFPGVSRAQAPGRARPISPGPGSHAGSAGDHRVPHSRRQGRQHCAVVSAPPAGRGHAEAEHGSPFEVAGHFSSRPATTSSVFRAAAGPVPISHRT